MAQAAIRISMFGVVVALFAGCASYPVSKNLREQAKPLTVGEVRAHPSAHTGTIVIWGGKIIDAVNSTNGGTIYVLALPLTSHEKPEWNGVTTGRFIARSKGFLDPEVFRNGQLITVAGEITGVANRPLQGIEYAYPVVAIKEIHLWYIARPQTYYYYPGWYGGWYGPGWAWDWYGPGWGWGWYGPDWD